MNKTLVIIPTYNEKENILSILRTVMNLPKELEVLVVDDSSPDGTAELVRSIQPLYPDKIHLIVRRVKDGLGKAYLHGFEWALSHGYRYIIEMDADFSHNPEDLPKLLAACENGADVSIGSRYSKGVNVVNWPMHRVLLSYFASKYVRLILGIQVHDTTAGFVCYTDDALRKIELNKVKLKGYGFQIEMKFRAWKKGLNIIEIPIVFTDRTEGKSKMSGGIVQEAVWGVIGLKIKALMGKI